MPQVLEDIALTVQTQLVAKVPFWWAAVPPSLPPRPCAFPHILCPARAPVPVLPLCGCPPCHGEEVGMGMVDGLHVGSWTCCPPQVCVVRVLHLAPSDDRLAAFPTPPSVTAPSMGDEMCTWMWGTSRWGWAPWWR